MAVAVEGAVSMVDAVVVEIPPEPHQRLGRV
jgi:hypothetical protein